MKEFWFEIREHGSGRWLWVKAAYHPPRRGERDHDGRPLEPDEPGELHIINVEERCGNPVAHQPMEQELLQTARALLAF